MSCDHIYIAGMSAMLVLLAVLLMYLASITLLPRHAEVLHFCPNNGMEFCAYA